MSLQIQCDRLLAELRRNPLRGVTGYDFSGPVVVDGGDRIMRVAARILDLKKAGYRFRDDAGKRDGHKIYMLEESVVGDGPEIGRRPVSHQGLFAVEPLRTLPLGAYDEDQAA